MDDLQTFRSRIRRYVRELNTSTSFWTDTFLNQLFNASYRRRCSQLIMAHENFFLTVATRDLEEGKSTYGFPDGVQRLTKLELVRTDGRTVPLQRYERHETPNFNTGSQGSGDNYYPTFRPFANGFVLEPEPVETVSDGLRMEYAGLPVQLTANTDKPHPSFPEILDELLVLDVVCAALDAEGLHEMGPTLSIYSTRDKWEEDFLFFIESRVIARSRIDPFKNHYSDY